MRLRCCGGSLCAHQAASGHVSVGLRYDAPAFLRDYATTRLRFCSLWARQAATFLRATMRLRFCGTTLRRACVSAGVRCGCAWGRHGVTLLYASVGSLADTSVCTEYAKLRYLFCADTSVRGGLKLRFCEVRLRCDCVSVRFCGFLRGLQRRRFADSFADSFANLPHVDGPKSRRRGAAVRARPESPSCVQSLTCPHRSLRCNPCRCNPCRCHPCHPNVGVAHMLRVGCRNRMSACAHQETGL